MAGNAIGITRVISNALKKFQSFRHGREVAKSAQKRAIRRPTSAENSKNSHLNGAGVRNSLKKIFVFLFEVKLS
jgi:hypothetical protein